jgi:lipopolysaccharide transport system ATP-binding protein
MAVAIKAEGLSKAYQLGEFSTGTLSQDIERMWYRLRGKEDPFLKIGESNDRTAKGDSNIVWSLKDINFEIRQGEAVGIIGRNGAGKSTLLKVLSRVTTPTAGSVKIKGRIASLLEVGTGFHPELTGRENIFLNGAILGMRKQEIKRKFDEIVAFAGVERYIDTPVKRYSSGMYVRLAFAVAAHLESEILIVDEVLAVGDAEFQKKCLGKMQDVSTNDGRTVLFVSHQMGTIAQLCQKAILLKNGEVVADGNSQDIISKYMLSNKAGAKYNIDEAQLKDKELAFEEIYTCFENGTASQDFKFEDSINIRLKLKKNIANIKHVKIGIALKDKFENRVFSALNDLEDFNIDEDGAIVNITLPKSLFAPGAYSFLFALHVPNQKMYDLVDGVCYVTIHDSGTEFAAIEGYHYGNIIINPEWRVVK